MFGPYFGIDLGTARTRVYQKGRGIIYDEPTVVAVGVKKNNVIAIGNDALAMVGKTPANIKTAMPLVQGVISEWTVAVRMFAALLKKISNAYFFRPRVLLSVPGKITQVEKRAYCNCAFANGIKEIHLIEEPLAASRGAGLMTELPGGNMVADLGAGISDIAVISLNGVVVSASEKIGGRDFDCLIGEYIRKKYSLLIGEVMAEKIKTEIGSAYPLKKEMTMEVSGRDIAEGSPKIISVKSEEIRNLFAEPLNIICGSMKKILEVTPPDLCGDILDRGIYLTGGMSLLKGVDRFVYDSIGVPAHVAENPMQCVVKGCGVSFSLAEKDELYI